MIEEESEIDEVESNFESTYKRFNSTLRQKTIKIAGGESKGVQFL